MNRSDDNTKAGDIEAGKGSARAGPYSLEWENGNEFFEGLGSDLDRTAEPVNKVGRGGLADGDDDESK